jgi:hypothetical protein
MGSMLNVICSACGHQAQQIDGAIMSGFNPRCTKCGRTRFVSISDLFDDQEQGSGRADFDSLESRVPIVAGKCRCGGQFTLDAPFRCRKCRSTDVVTEDTGLMVD